MKKLITLICVLTLTSWSFAQTMLTGKVTDSTQEPVIGASIIIKGTNQGTVTDINGKFSLKTNLNEGTIVFSFIGMKTIEQLFSSSQHFEVVLEDEITSLNDVVVLGYGVSSRKQDLSAAVGVISNTDDIAARPVSNTESMLQGQLAGVTVSSDGGDPTATPSVVIRGEGSQNGDNVLWVVDGVPGAPIASMDDIASIVVLKDAASAAIYGAHSGAGGVILVTTKKAKAGEPSVSYDMVMGMRQATNLPQSLTAEEEIDMNTIAYTNAGESLPTGWSTTANPWIATTRTDWMDEIFRTANFQRHNVSFNVGNDVFNHRLSFAINNDEGTLLNTFNKNLSLRYNSGFKLNKWVSINEDLTWTNSKSRGTNTSSGYSGVILSALYMPRSATVYSEDGSYGGTTTEDEDYIATYGSNYSDIHGDVVNPVRTLLATNEYDKTSTIWTTTSLEIADIIRGLKFTSRFTYNLATNYYKSFTPIRDEVGKPDTSNSLSESSYRTDQWKTENTLTYDRIFGSHSFSALLSTTADHYESRGLSVSASGFADESDNLQYLAYASSTSSSDYLTGPDANVSFISRLAYSYNDRYFLTGSFRRDYAGRLPDDNNYGDFPAATAAWKISNESFFHKSDMISLLKLRASWGRVGNLSSIGYNYKSPTLSVSENTYSETGQAGVSAGETRATQVYYSTALNEDLTWETSEQMNIGLDVEMFRNRLNLSMDYFKKRTYNLIQTASFEWPSTMGLDAMYVNQGEIKNSGLELQASWHGKINSDMSYFISGNLATLKNRVSDIGVKNSDGTAGVWTGDGSFRSVLPYMYQTAEGEPLNSYYLIKTDGIFQSDAEAEAYVDANGDRIQPDAVAGDLKFVDYSEDGTIDSDDRQYMGNATPELTYAFNLGFTYKKLSISAMFQGVSGAQALNVAKSVTLNAVEGNYNRSNEILKAWSETNKSSDIPRLSKTDPNGNVSTPSDWYLENASYLRLKNVTVSYDLTNLITRSSYFANRKSNASVYLSGDNLATFTDYSGIDPECGGYDAMKYPVSRVLSFGVKLTY